MQPCWRCAARRWRSGRRRSRSAGRGAGRGWRRRSAWRCSARSAGERCGCRGTGLSRRSSCRCWRLPRSPICGDGSRAGGRRCARGGQSRWSACWPPRSRSSSKVTSGSSAPASTRTCPSTCWPPTGSPTAQGGQLLHQGYPLGPHAIVVALNKGLGIGLVQGFSGLTVAVAVLAPLTALAAFAELRPLPRTAARAGRRPRLRRRLLLRPGRLQGDDRRPSSFSPSSSPCARRPRTWRDLPLRFVPAALIAAGSVYTYSFPGLIWLVAALVIWLALEPADRGGRRWRPLLLALLVFVVLVAPEIGRMLDFHSFETFDPNGPGLGNLFGQVSPFEALGIWPSGDFRLAPGDGAVPAFGYYLGAAFAPSCCSTASSLLAAPRDGDPRRPGRRRPRLRRRPPRRHPLHRRQGDRDRRADRRAHHPAAAARPSRLAP